MIIKSNKTDSMLFTATQAVITMAESMESPHHDGFEVKSLQEY